MNRRRYLTYMLPLWQTNSPDEVAVCPASLESLHTGERHGFPDLEMPRAFLQEKIHFQPQPVGEEGDTQ